MAGILALDGGGVKGALSARILERLEVEAPFLHNIKLFAGTSTGGIIALALAARVSVSDIVSLYRDHSSTIFQSRDWVDKVSGGMDEYVRANYGQEGLRGVLTDVFGDLRLPDLETDVLLPCFDLMRFRPKFLDRTDDWSLVDAALATSAAPTYFPGHIVHEAHTAEGSRVTQRGAVRCLVDGGVFANNPSTYATSFATAKLGWDVSDIVMLSLGAGATPYRPPEELLHDASKTLDWGYRQWIVKAPHPLMKILFDGSVTAAHYSSKTQLGDRYHRLQPPLPEDVDLAAFDKVPLLLAVADGYELNGAVDWTKENLSAAA
jgi:predicted acylesterase/phospholipase RssA